MRWVDGNPVCQDAFNALDGGTVLPALVGLASGAQAVNGMLQSELFDTSSFNTPAASGYWRSYSPADPSQTPWPPVAAEDLGGISGQDVNNSFALGLSLSSRRAAAPSSAQLLMNGSPHDVEPSTAIPYTQAVNLQPGLPENTPIAVSFMLASQL